MFGNKSLPSRIYSYGANAPMEKLDVVCEQMFLAHRYKNNIVEGEHDRREAVEAACRKLSPKLKELDGKISKLDKAIEVLLEDLKRDHVLLRTRNANDPEKVAKIKKLREERSVLYKERAAVRKEIWSSRAWKKAEKPIETEARAGDKERRGESQLYWGSYLHVEQSMSKRRSGAPPRFTRWEGKGHLAVQIQKGMSPAEALSGEDSRLKITLGRVEVEGSRTATTGIMRKLGTAICHFRVGTDDERNPVFAKVPFTLHRPLPEDSEIKWVHLIRRKIGTHDRWMLQFVVSKKKWVREDASKEGACGIDLGYRVIPEEGLRVAVLRGSDDAERELFLPPGWMSQMRRTGKIRSIRAENFDDAKACLMAWLKDAGEKSWVKEEAVELHLWRSFGRLAGLVLKWREKRLKGDDEIYILLEEWRKRDKHLYEYEANLVDQLGKRRESIYRNFAAEIRRVYKTAVIQKVDRRTVHENPNPEDYATDPGLKEHVRDACLSSLERFIKESMTKTVEVANKDIARKHVCGSKEEPEKGARFHTCTRCGETYDVDENAAMLLLKKARVSSNVMA